METRSFNRLILTHLSNPVPGYVNYTIPKNYDLKAVNPNAKSNEDTRTPEELLDIIEAKGKEVAEAVATLRSKTFSAR